jgi:hypothetical protein
MHYYKKVVISLYFINLGITLNVYSEQNWFCSFKIIILDQCSWFMKLPAADAEWWLDG